MRLFRYIGTVTSHTHFTENGKRTGDCVHHYWLLFVGPFGWRRTKAYGKSEGMSPSAQEMRARVIAWKNGGALPPLADWSQERPPAPVLKIVRD